MIIGKGKPRVYENTDRWGRLDGTYSVKEPVSVGLALWKQLWGFEHFDLVVFGPSGDSSVTPDQYRRYVEAALRRCPQVSTLWEFNGDTLDFRDKIRMLAVFNEVTLVPWSWFDVHVLYPLARARAWLLNHTRKPKRFVLRGLHGAVLTPEQEKNSKRETSEDCGP